MACANVLHHSLSAPESGYKSQFNLGLSEFCFIARDSDIAGQGKANPYAMLLSVAMMLRQS